ncbi:solute carrier family 22 member 18 isoform X6 [Lagenorhynchus albirostris]|uniref:solute carrier family 22 member 18 isoform X6 n=1 Tax=Lagenorhynchus albirostris TaxID=27610 RepID=UPI0028EAD18B|nr:solute carrier family 22 member 18 isoform X6 [Lagenorhynchus albirostris]
MGYRCARNGGLRDDTADLDLSPWKGGSINGGAEELVLEGDRESVLDVLSSSTCPGGWAWTLLPSATSRPSLACFSCWAGPCLAGSQTSAGRGQRSRSPSWRPQRSTCSWLPPAARPCPACPYSLPRACPAPSCTRCQVGPAAQMAITDLSAPEERPAALGRLGLCFGVGVIFGSLLGGTLSSTCGIQCPVIVALVVSLLGAVLSLTCLPTSTKGASARAQSALPGLFMVMFSLISMDFFQLEAAQAGYLMSFFGVLQMVFQGLVIGRLSSRFSEGALLRASVLAFSVVGLAMALMANVFHLCLLIPGLVFSLCALNVATDSMLTSAVSASDTGTMLGLCASVQPLARTLGPTLGGLLHHRFAVPVFGHVQLAVNFLVLLVLWRQPVPPKMDKAW